MCAILENLGSSEILGSSGVQDGTGYEPMYWNRTSHHNYIIQLFLQNSEWCLEWWALDVDTRIKTWGAK